MFFARLYTRIGCPMIPLGEISMRIEFVALSLTACMQFSCQCNEGEGTNGCKSRIPVVTTCKQPLRRSPRYGHSGSRDIGISHPASRPG